MTLLRPFALMALAATLACHDTTAPAPELAPAFALAKARWASAGLHAYTFDASRSCECTADGSGPVRVVVRNDQVESVTLIATGQPVAASLWFDVPGLFALIEREMLTNPELLEATFDGVLGHPTRVKWGHVEVDAGAVIFVTGLTPK